MDMDMNGKFSIHGKPGRIPVFHLNVAKIEFLGPNFACLDEKFSKKKIYRQCVDSQKFTVGNFPLLCPLPIPPPRRLHWSAVSVSVGLNVLGSKRQRGDRKVGRRTLVGL